MCVTVPFFPSILVTTEAFSLVCSRAELQGWPSGSLSPMHPEAQLYVLFLWIFVSHGLMFIARFAPLVLERYTSFVRQHACLVDTTSTQHCANLKWMGILVVSCSSSQFTMDTSILETLQILPLIDIKPNSLGILSGRKRQHGGKRWEFTKQWAVFHKALLTRLFWLGTEREGNIHWVPPLPYWSPVKHNYLAKFAHSSILYKV